MSPSQEGLFRHAIGLVRSAAPPSPRACPAQDHKHEAPLSFLREDLRITLLSLNLPGQQYPMTSRYAPSLEETRTRPRVFGLLPLEQPPA
jgi:hypothetical protein